MKFLQRIALVTLALVATGTAQADWTTDVEGTVAVTDFRIHGTQQAVYHRFTAATDSSWIRVPAAWTVKVCVNANTGGTGANGVTLNLLGLHHNTDTTKSVNDATIIENATLTGVELLDCIWDVPGGWYLIDLITGPTANAAYVTMIVTAKAIGTKGIHP